MPALPGPRLVEAIACLVAGVVLVGLTGIEAIDLAAAWLYPVFLLRFARLAPPISGFAVLSIALGGVAYLTERDTLPLPPVVLEISFLIGGIAFAGTFLADRLIAPRLRGIAATLVFPAATTAFFFVFMFGAPFGTWGNAAYLQHDFAILRQAVSVTGLWGVVFLVAWAAAVANQLRESASHVRAAARATAAFAIVLAAALAFGANQMRDTPTADEGYVRIAALGNPPETRNIYAGCVGDDSGCLDDATRRRNDVYFSLAEEAASRGAAIIVWPETAVRYGASREPEIFARAAELAQRRGVHLVLGTARFPDEGPVSELVNKAVVFAPDGALVGEYHKAALVPGEPGIPGDGAPLVFPTPYGRAAVFICFEADFLAPARRAVREGAELLIVPANDWAEIADVHAEMAAMRAVENGVPLVRAVSNGVSVAYDAAGRTLARNDAFATPDFIMIADMNLSRRTTFYRHAGDYFAWGSVALLAGLSLAAAGGAIRRRRGASRRL